MSYVHKRHCSVVLTNSHFSLESANTRCPRRLGGCGWSICSRKGQEVQRRPPLASLACHAFQSFEEFYFKTRKTAACVP